MKTKDFFQIGANGIQYLISIAQVEDVLRITGIVLSVIISVLIIIDKIVSWVKRAKADGVITEDEIHEGINIVKEGTQEIKEHIEKSKK